MLLDCLIEAQDAGKIVLLVSLLVEVPLCALGSFHFLAVFSAAGCASTVAVMLLVAALPAIDPERDCVNEVTQHSMLRPGIVPAMGIFAVRFHSSACFLLHSGASSNISLFQAFTVLGWFLRARKQSACQRPVGCRMHVLPRPPAKQRALCSCQSRAIPPSRPCEPAWPTRAPFRGP